MSTSSATALSWAFIGLEDLSRCLCWRSSTAGFGSSFLNSDTGFANNPSISSSASPLGGGGAGDVDFCAICFRPNISSSSSANEFTFDDCGRGVWPRDAVALNAGVLRPLPLEGGGKWLALSTGAAELNAARRSSSAGDCMGRLEAVSRPANGLLIVCDSVCLLKGLFDPGGGIAPKDEGSGVLFPLTLFQNCESAPPKLASYCFLRSASCLSFSSWSCFWRSCNERPLPAGFELLVETSPAKLSLAGVAGFTGALNGLEDAAAAPDCCAESPERGVDRPESCGVGLWRKGGNAAGVVEGCLAGCDQSRLLRSSIAVSRCRSTQRNR